MSSPPVSAWHPDGTRLALVGSEGLFIHGADDGALWNARPTSGGTSVAYSPSGDQLVVGHGKRLSWHDPETGSSHAPLIHSRQIERLVPASQGRVVASAAGEAVRVWTPDRAYVPPPPYHRGEPLWVGFDRQLVARTFDTIGRVDVATGEELWAWDDATLAAPVAQTEPPPVALPDSATPYWSGVPFRCGSAVRHPLEGMSFGFSDAGDEVLVAVNDHAYVRRVDDPEPRLHVTSKGTIQAIGWVDGLPLVLAQGDVVTLADPPHVVVEGVNNAWLDPVSGGLRVDRGSPTQRSVSAAESIRLADGTRARSDNGRVVFRPTHR